MFKAICVTALVLAAVSSARCAESYLGTVISVIDGDTFRIKTETVKIRLCGVDRVRNGGSTAMARPPTPSPASSGS